MTEVISDIKELIALTELQDVVFWEVSGKRNDADADAESPLQIESMWRQGEQKRGLRFRATVVGEGGDYIADAEAIFDLSEDREVDQATLHAFVERVRIMIVFPYLRSAVAESATKLSLPRPVLKLIRAGEAQFSK